MTKTIIVEYPDLDLSLSATLLEDMNPELCEVIWNHLPIESMQEHAVVSGESIYCWTPIIATVPVRHRERVNETPIGRLRYSPMTGNKIAMRYGPVTEPLAHTAPFGQVVEEDLEKLKVVGKAVWEAIYYTKSLIRVRFRKGEEG